MSRKRNSNRKTMARLHSIVPCTNIEECELEYYRPGCYCIPQVVPNGTPCTCAYLHEYVPQWKAACNTATYVADTYGMVYYLSDFEHQLQFPNNMVETEITYHIPTYADEHDCRVPIEVDEGEAVSPRKRERLENENDLDDAEGEVSRETRQDNYHESSCTEFGNDQQEKSADIVAHGYYVEEPPDTDTKAEEK